MSSGDEIEVNGEIGSGNNVQLKLVQHVTQDQRVEVARTEIAWKTLEEKVIVNLVKKDQTIASQWCSELLIFSLSRLNFSTMTKTNVPESVLGKALFESCSLADLVTIDDENLVAGLTLKTKCY